MTWDRESPRSEREKRLREEELRNEEIKKARKEIRAELKRVELAPRRETPAPKVKGIRQRLKSKAKSIAKKAGHALKERVVQSQSEIQNKLEREKLRSQLQNEKLKYQLEKEQYKANIRNLKLYGMSGSPYEAPRRSVLVETADGKKALAIVPDTAQGTTTMIVPSSSSSQQPLMYPPVVVTQQEKRPPSPLPSSGGELKGIVKGAQQVAEYVRPKVVTLRQFRQPTTSIQPEKVVARPFKLTGRIGSNVHTNYVRPTLHAFAVGRIGSNVNMNYARPSLRPFVSRAGGLHRPRLLSAQQLLPTLMARRSPPRLMSRNGNRALVVHLGKVYDTIVLRETQNALLVLNPLTRKRAWVAR